MKPQLHRPPCDGQTLSWQFANIISTCTFLILIHDLNIVSGLEMNVLIMMMLMTFVTTTTTTIVMVVMTTTSNDDDDDQPLDEEGGEPQEGTGALPRVCSKVPEKCVIFLCVVILRH